MWFIGRDLSKRIVGAEEIEEKIITKAELMRAEEIWFINSVRKWLKVKLDE